MRRWKWTIAAWFGIIFAAMIDAFILPGPPAPRLRLTGAGSNIVSVSPPLHKGDPFPETVILREGDVDTTLTLTGGYTRSRYVLITDVDFYEVSSYVEFPPKGSTSDMLESLWRDDGRKAYLLRFLISVPGWQLRKAVHDEIARSFEDVSLDEHREEIEGLLNAFATGASSGDVFYIARLPGNRIHLGVRDGTNLAFVTASSALSKAVWRMWAGPTAEPGRAGLVKKLFGKE